MMWDAGNRAIYFDGMDDDKPLGKRIEVRL
jgi:hypothetical protein